jgi:site-specific recombinase XerD
MCFKRKLISAEVRPRISPTVKQFTKFTRNLTISKVKQEDIERFYRYFLVQDQKQSPHTVDKKVGYIKRMFTYAKANEYIGTSPL